MNSCTCRPQSAAQKHIQVQRDLLKTFFDRELILDWYIYSFKIFPRFWLAKSTRLIHHNQ